MRIAFYARVSTERQQHAQTIEQQLTQLRAYVAAQEGWTVGEEHIFRDDGYSGAKLDRLSQIINSSTAAIPVATLMPMRNCRCQVIRGASTSAARSPGYRSLLCESRAI